MRGAVIVMLRSRVLWKVHSKDHAVTAPSSTTSTAPRLHHYQGRHCKRVGRGQPSRRARPELARVMYFAPARTMFRPHDLVGVLC